MSNADISLVLCGEAGQGIQTVEDLLKQALKRAGYNIFCYTEFMSRIRGGTNSTEIRVSSARVGAFVERINLLFAFSKGAFKHLQRRISPDTILLGEKENLAEAPPGSANRLIEVPFTDLATAVGHRIYTNTVAGGVVAGLFQIAPEIINGYLRGYFADKSAEIVEKNIEAAAKGYEIGQSLRTSGRITIGLPPDARVKNDIVISGTQAVALGAIAGGCNYLCAYPMSPSTGVLVFLAQHAREFGIIVEQVEDEIGVMNMALGASYAGARAMVTTSGGGFDLMTEGMSLAGVMEMPVVVHLAQRPGPATGLPTRTEQADLNLALYAGHGEFPRLILTPGRIEEAFFLTQRAFNLAAKYQTPVIVLTDQYLVDSSGNVPPFDLRGLRAEKHLVAADKDYRRYAITESGISPRSVPGYGEGLVPADSHEHLEDGHITEREDVRIQMVNKRLRKGQAMLADVVPPELVGSRDYRTLIVGWGSTYGPIREALEALGRDDVAFLHFKQVHPLPPATVDYLRKASKLVLIEGNATGQFGNLLKLHTGVEIGERILKYSGMPFSVEELVDRLQDIV